MGVGRRIARAALAGELDRRMLPVVVVAFAYSLAFSTFWVYLGVFVVDGLGWPPGAVGVLFLVEAPIAAAANFGSGLLADRVGRKGPIVGSFLAASATVLGLAAARGEPAVAFVLIGALGVVGAPAYSLDRVL